MNVLNIDRGDTQTHYLTTPDKYGAHRYVEMGQLGSAARFGVLRFTDDSSDRVLLKVDSGPFQMWSSLTRDEARLLALALTTACAEAEGGAS